MIDGGYNLNRLFPGTAIRPFNQFGSISMTRNDLISSYNSLQTSFRKRFSRRLTDRNLNRLFPGTAIRPFNQFGSISMTRNDLISSYNSLQTSFRKRFSRGLTFNVNYAWSHSLDEGGLA